MTTQSITATPPVTLEEFAALPKHPRYELVKGVLIELMAASREHARTVIRTGRYLDIHVDVHGLGEVYGCNRAYVTVASPPATSRMPDVSFVSNARLDQPELAGMLYDGALRSGGGNTIRQQHAGADRAKDCRIPERRRQSSLGHRH